MAFDDAFTSQPYDTSTIVLPSRRYFKCDIQVKHWQLRNLISSDQPNVINYVTHNKIRQLDLNKDTDSLIADLTFIPRCSASGYGYICAAGEEKGMIAIINLDPGSSESSEVDEQVSVHGMLQGDRSGRRSSRPKRQPSVKLDHIGESIINSIAIYKMEGNPKMGIRDDVVALLTNNDKTVRILSLSEGLETAVMGLTFPVNHATISPDGETLVVVGDHQQAFFFEKISLDPRESRVPKQRLASSHCRWALLNIARLHFPRSVGISGYFSTAWSASGALCAVASENGYITILDVKRIKAEECGEDAIVTVVSSTRPHGEPGPGSIRTLHFSPPPWDLLIWSEGRGRICVADMRYALNTRQVLPLNPGPLDGMTTAIEVDLGKEVEPVVLRDPPHVYISPSRASHMIQQRRISRDHTIVESPPSMEDESSSSGSRRRITRLVRNEVPSAEETTSQALPALESTLDPDERIILNVLRQGTHSDSAPRSIRYQRHPPGRSRDDAGSSSRLADNSELLSDAMSVLRRHRGEINRYNAQSIPRRQTGPLSEDEQQPMMPTRTWAELSAEFVPTTVSQPHFQDYHMSMSQAYNPYHNFGEASQIPQPSRPSRYDDDEEDDIINYNSRLRRAHDREQRLREAYKLTRHDAQMLAMTSLRNREDGPQSAGLLTAGIVVSPDGQTIWAGSEDGIYEFKLNMRDLMNFPSLEAR